jgi:hypothetical protein
MSEALASKQTLGSHLSQTADGAVSASLVMRPDLMHLMLLLLLLLLALLLLQDQMVLEMRDMIKALQEDCRSLAGAITQLTSPGADVGAVLQALPPTLVQVSSVAAVVLLLCVKQNWDTDGS